MTYKNMLLGKMKYLILFLIAIQSILLALVAIFLAGLQYQQSWQSYNHHSGTVTVYLQKLYGQNVLKVVIQEKVQIGFI